jgi:hypothetical protein
MLLGEHYKSGAGLVVRDITKSEHQIIRWFDHHSRKFPPYFEMVSFNEATEVDTLQGAQQAK